MLRRRPTRRRRRMGERDGARLRREALARRGPWSRSTADQLREWRERIEYRRCATLELLAGYAGATYGDGNGSTFIVSAIPTW